MQIAILRHGSTEFNEHKLYAGRTDVPLSEEGERQALACGVRPEVAIVYVSPLSRARRTARLCFPNARQVVVEGLREMDFGDFEGRSAWDMENDREYRAWVDSMCTAPCPHGESRDHLERRVDAAVCEIVRDALAEGRQNVVVVGHGGTIMAAMDVLADDGRDYFDWSVGNCEGYRARVSVDGEGCVRLHDPLRFRNLDFMDEEGAWQPRPAWKDPSTFFSNRECEYFPCHEGVPEDEFNCLFCYCPLYALGPGCGGNFTYLESGVKSCMDCPLPHVRDHGAKMVQQRFSQLAQLARKDFDE